jgi:hypothetical protein
MLEISVTRLGEISPFGRIFPEKNAQIIFSEKSPKIIVISQRCCM